MGFDGWASGGVGDAEGLPTLALVEVVVGDGLRVRGVEVGGLVEVVGERFLGGLFWYYTLDPAGTYLEFGLRRSPGGMDQPGRAGLTDVGEDLGDGLGLGEERDEGERRLAAGTDQREHLIDPGRDERPQGSVGGEDAVVTVAVDAGRRKDGRETVEELES